jgi:hypothetical protein
MACSFLSGSILWQQSIVGNGAKGEISLGVSSLPKMSQGHSEPGFHHLIHTALQDKDPAASVLLATFNLFSEVHQAAYLLQKLSLADVQIPPASTTVTPEFTADLISEN